ncbi:MAG: twin-arginine translocase TatA/TatE family subunit [Bdellovibrionota bacterium]
MELSFPEILLVLAIALIVMGPRDLIKTSQQLGRWMGKIKTQINNLKVVLTEEVMQEDKDRDKTKDE